MKFYYGEAKYKERSGAVATVAQMKTAFNAGEKMSSRDYPMADYAYHTFPSCFKREVRRTEEVLYYVARIDTTGQIIKKKPVKTTVRTYTFNREEAAKLFNSISNNENNLRSIANEVAKLECLLND